MLWHGSSLRNFLGILASGLRIAPPTANINGHAFGRGIYFADTFEKSWGYTHGSEKYVFMLICEVALGNMLQLNTFQQISGLDSIFILLNIISFKYFLFLRSVSISVRKRD